jgi:uncharacterized lipoprotein YajG
MVTESRILKKIKMKTIKIISILIVTLLLSGCEKDSDIFDIVESIDAPTNISADFFYYSR